MRARRYIWRHPLGLLIGSSLGFGLWALWAFPETGRLYRYDTLVYVTIAETFTNLLVLLSVAGLVVAIVLYALNYRLLEAVGAGIVTMLSAIILLVLGYLQIEHPLSHIANVRAGDHVYNLAYTNIYDSGFGSITFLLYECDSLSLICHVVQREQPHEYILFRRTILQDAKLLTNDDANTVSLEIGGEVVYTHQVEE